MQNDIHEIEERKNAHINELMKKHEKAFSEIKSYFNDITGSNMEKIKELKVWSYFYSIRGIKCLNASVPGAIDRPQKQRS